MFDIKNNISINAPFKHLTSATVYIYKVCLIVLFTSFATKKPTLFVYLLTPPPPFLKKKTPTKILSSTDNGVIFKKNLSTFFYMSKYDVELIERFPFNSTPGHHHRHTSTPYHWKPWIFCYNIKSIIKKRWEK